MRIITAHEAKVWCDTHGVALPAGRPPDARTTPGMTDFTIPQDAGQRTAVVKGHMERLKGKPWLLLWVDDWSVWPSGQWHHVFTRLRLSYGCAAPLIEKPAHLVEAAEHDAAVSVAVYSVLMLWDCYVIGDGGLMLFYSHDEWGRIAAANA